MGELASRTAVRSRIVGNMAIVYADDYLNKLSGERIEGECRRRLEAGCQALVINFKDTKLVNSIGISILLGVIEAAEKTGAELIFSDLQHDTIQLFEMLGLTKHVALANNELEALNVLNEFAIHRTPGH